MEWHSCRPAPAPARVAAAQVSGKASVVVVVVLKVVAVPEGRLEARLEACAEAVGAEDGNGAAAGGTEPAEAASCSRTGSSANLITRSAESVQLRRAAGDCELVLRLLRCNSRARHPTVPAHDFCARGVDFCDCERRAL